MSSSIDQLFHSLRESNQKAFMPFITAGDPDLQFTADCLKKLDAAGCHLIELGIPYSDPIADGPVIQASYTRALNQNIRLDAILQMLTDVTPLLQTPVVMMVSYAIIFRRGVDKFLQDAVTAGVAGAIVPDMPADEAEELAAKCKSLDFSLIQLITPTTTAERAVSIAETTTGFIYYVSIAGITGERTELPADLVSNLQELRKKTDLPICVGFGISRPDQAEMLKPVADGVIVGSAIVRRVADCSTGKESSEYVLESISDFSKTMISALESTD